MVREFVVLWPRFCLRRGRQSELETASTKVMLVYSVICLGVHVRVCVRARKRPYWSESRPELNFNGTVDDSDSTYVLCCISFLGVVILH